MMNTYGPKTLRGAKKHRVDPTGRIMEVDRHRSILSEVDSIDLEKQRVGLSLK